MNGKDSGSWSAEEHRQRSARAKFNDGLARFIVSELKPQDLLEFGGGLGYMADYITRQRRLALSYVIEPQVMGDVYGLPGGPKQLALDIFEEPLPTVLNRRFDLVLSIEVAEHIERARHPFLFDFLVSHAANWIVFSGARVGQGGHGHVAERPESEWRREFVSRGATFLEGPTAQIRAACNERNINHRRNVMIFAAPK